MTDLPHNLLLRDLAVVMLVAGLVTLVFHRLRQPVVLGYILAGLIIGPHTPPFPLIADERSIDTLAELGVVFLMFSLGMEFSLRTLRRVGLTAVMGAVVEIVGMLWLGYELGQLFGWRKMDSLFLGAILCISSTTITVKVLTEMGRLKERFAELSLGILIVEDILAIALIAVLSGIATTGGLNVAGTAFTLGKIVAFLILLLVAGLLAVPRLLRYVAQYRSNEMLLVTVLGLCFGVSLLTVQLGYSVALGAFLIGTIVGEAREIGRIKVLTEPVRDMFSAVFFVSVGLLINPRVLLENAGAIAMVTAVTVAGKVVTRACGVFAAGHSTRTSLRVAMTLAQIGEFSFIIAALGGALRVTSDFIYPLAVSVSVITTLLTPYLVRGADAAVARFDQAAPRWLVGLLDLYSRWIERVRTARTDHPGRRLAQRWIWQIGINVALVSALFLTAAALAPRAERWWPHLPLAVGGARGVVWLAAAVVALPGLIAAVRKLQALAMLISEMSEATVAVTLPVRKVVYHSVFVAGCLALAFWVLALSSTLLPTGPALVSLLLLVSLLTILLWRYFIQVHAKAQISLLETFSESRPAAEPAAAALPSLLGAQLDAVTIATGAPAAGRLIRELELRTRTGASIVGIERTDTRIINPGPDEELKAGDRVLLLGTGDHLAAARALLAQAGPPAPSP